MNWTFQQDWFAAKGREWRGGRDYIELVSDINLRYIAAGRISTQSKSKLIRLLFRFVRHRMAVNRCTEISFQNIKEGLSISHCFGITIHAQAKIGRFVSLRKGVTIGAELRGNRKGTPTIGNRVWIGPNASVVGKISIGNDVLVAPNSYVNFDVPDHSIVVGNPGKIYKRSFATEGYLVYYRESAD